MVDFVASREPCWLASLPAYRATDLNPHSQIGSNVPVAFLQLSNSNQVLVGSWALGGLCGLSVIQPHLSWRQGRNWASSFFLSLPILLSTVSTENVNLAGWGPSTGSSIVLASPQHLGAWPSLGTCSWPGLSPSGYRSRDSYSGASAIHFLAGGQPLGTPSLDRPSLAPDASAKCFQQLSPHRFSHSCVPLTSPYFPQRKKRGRSKGRRRGCRISSDFLTG